MLSVGDNVYPNGMANECATLGCGWSFALQPPGALFSSHAHPADPWFEATFTNVYTHTGLKTLPWCVVLTRPEGSGKFRLLFWLTHALAGTTSWATTRHVSNDTAARVR